MKSTLRENTEWFEEWFDSPYYHVLYKDRDDNEAKAFLSKLIEFLLPEKGSSFLDVACGMGRHSIYLNNLGFNVDGFDLSENNIETAKKNETKGLKFYINDIRNPLKVDHYDYVFNLFTSFGYFQSEQDHQSAINAMAKSLKKNGVLVLDFMNSNKVIGNLCQKEVKVINDIKFDIEKYVSSGYIVKDIRLVDDKKELHYQEKVKAITLDHFKSYFEVANLKIETTFGDYKLNPFDVAKSDRLILIARKP